MNNYLTTSINYFNTQTAMFCTLIKSKEAIHPNGNFTLLNQNLNT